MTILQLLRSNPRWIKKDNEEVQTIDIYPDPSGREPDERITITPLFTEPFKLVTERRGILSAIGNPNEFLTIRINDDESIEITRYERGKPDDPIVLIKSDIPAAEAEPAKQRRVRRPHKNESI